MNALRDWWRWHRWLPGFAIAWCLCDCAYCARKRRRARHRRDLLNLWELVVGWWRGRRREPLRVEWADKKEDP